MEFRMPNLRKRAGTPRFLVLVLAVVASLTLAGAASAEFPTKRQDPSVRGTAQEGQTLAGQTGQWLMDNGLACIDCTRRWTWQRCNADTSGCADIPGATTFNYTLVAADVGTRIRLVEWIFKRDCGAGSSQDPLNPPCADIEKNAVSALTEVVAPRAVTIAQASAPPTLQGVAMEDEVLRATGGTWAGPGTIRKAIFWQRCNAVGEACATIVGATGEAYRLTSADVGARLRVIETATNEGGTAQAVSQPTGVVVELRPSRTRPTIAASRVELPHRLIVDRIVVRQSGSRVTVQIRVSDDRGFRVSGVLVRAQPTAFLAGSAAARATAQTGWATFSYRAIGSGTTYVYAEASKRGERAQSGVSSANLFRIRVR
jgi:hypothetical protein